MLILKGVNRVIGNPLAIHVYAVNMFEEMPVKDTVVDSLVFLCVLLLIHL